MAIRLTKRVLDAIQPSTTETFMWDADLRGFGVRVSPRGRKSFIVAYRMGGNGSQARRQVLGVYGVLTVDEARDRARRILARVAEGIDPVAEAEAAKAAAKAATQADERRQREEEVERERQSALRLDRLAERFMAEHVALKRKKTTYAFYRIVLDKHLLPALGTRDVREITRQDVAKLHAGLAAKATTANRAVAVLGSIYGWADRLEILPEGSRNPTAKLEKFAEHGRDRFLSIDELARLGAAIREAETAGIEWAPRPEGKTKHAPKAENRRVTIAPEAAAAVRLLLFTGARLREILNLEWAAVDVDRGLLRLRDSKTGPKVIVLNAPARAVLAGLPRDGRFVVGGSVAVVDGKLIEKPRADLKRPWALVTKAAGLDGLRIHDLRHSFASVGAGDGHGLTIVGKLLGHATTRMTERYSHLDADPLRKASDAIATRIAAAIGEAPEAPVAEVVQLRRGDAA